MKEYARRVRRERELHSRSQEQVAEKLGTTAPNVSRWERGKTFPDTYYRQKLCKLFGKNAEELGLLQNDADEKSEQSPHQQAVAQDSKIARDKQDEPQHQIIPLEPHTALPPGIACVYDPAIPLPFSDAKNLVGRETLLQQVKEQLSHSGRVALSALHGIPGVGKTALAVVLAHDFEIREHFRDGILWAGLGPMPDVLGVLSRWGKLLSIASAERAKLSSSEAWAVSIRAAIGLHRMLLVIDDAWDTEEAMSFHVGGPNCAYLLTTRFPLIAAAFAAEGAILVPELSEADGVALLARFAPEAVAHYLGSAHRSSNSSESWQGQTSLWFSAL